MMVCREAPRICSSRLAQDHSDDQRSKIGFVDGKEWLCDSIRDGKRNREETMLIISRPLADRRDEAFLDDKVAWNGYEPGSLAIPTTDEVILEST